MHERRVRTWWVMRERYRRVAWAASATGVALGLLPFVAVLREDGATALEVPRFLVVSALLIAAGALVPRWLVMGLWRRQRLRRGLDWTS